MSWDLANYLLHVTRWLILGTSRYHAVPSWTVCRAIDCDFAFCALDADGRSGGIAAVWVSGDAEVCKSDTVGGWGGGMTAGCGGEVENHGGHFVGAGRGVGGDGRDDGGGFAERWRERVVEDLEDPG